METVLIIDERGETVRLITNNIITNNTNKRVRRQTETSLPFHGLKKWEVLSDRFDREFGEHTTHSNDVENRSYMTFKYSNGIWIHIEPFEFLIDHNDYDKIEDDQGKSEELVKTIRDLVESVNYDVDFYDPDLKRIYVNLPFPYF